MNGPKNTNSTRYKMIEYKFFLQYLHKYNSF